MTRQFQHSVTQAQQMLGGVGRSTVYRLASAGELKFVHIGRRAFVTDESLREYVARLQAGSANDRVPSEVA